MVLDNQVARALPTGESGNIAMEICMGYRVLLKHLHSIISIGARQPSGAFPALSEEHSINAGYINDDLLSYRVSMGSLWSK